MKIFSEEGNMKKIVEIRALKSVFSIKTSINSEILESHLNIATPITVSLDQTQASILKKHSNLMGT